MKTVGALWFMTIVVWPFSKTSVPSTLSPEHSKGIAKISA